MVVAPTRNSWRRNARPGLKSTITSFVGWRITAPIPPSSHAMQPGDLDEHGRYRQGHNRVGRLELCFRPPARTATLVEDEDIVPFSAVWAPGRDNPSLRRFLSLASRLASETLESACGLSDLARRVRVAITRDFGALWRTPVRRHEPLKHRNNELFGVDDRLAGCGQAPP